MNKLEVGQLVWFFKDEKLYTPPHYGKKAKRVVKCQFITGTRKKGTSICLMAMHLYDHGSEKIMFKAVDELIFTEKALKKQIKQLESEGFTILY